MTGRDESAGRRRREFRNIAGGVGTALVATADVRGQGARPNSAAITKRRTRSPRWGLAHSIVPYLVHAPSGPNSALRLWPRVEASRAG